MMATQGMMATQAVHTTIEGPFGPLVLEGHPAPEAAGGVALTRLYFPGQHRGGGTPPAGREDPEAFVEAARQLAEYFCGDRIRFELTHAARGTAFQQRVWAALDTIPHGTTTTYGAVARTAGATRGAVRAVAAAIGANPLLIVRPCHRVIGAGGALTGYAGGLDRKRLLLDLEAAPRPRTG